MRLAGNTGRKKSPKSPHQGTIPQLCRAKLIPSQLRHVSTIGKNLLSSNISSTCPHNMANFGPLTAEIRWRVWGTPANFNGFRVLASLLQRCRSTNVNQTLHDVWPYPGLVQRIYIFGVSCPITVFCQLQNSLSVQILHSPILTALLHSTRALCVSHTLWQGGHHVGHCNNPKVQVTSLS